MSLSKRHHAHSFIVFTSIFEPTEAILKFRSVTDRNIVVVGDQKSPAEWSADGITFFSLADQKRMGFYIHSALPENHYCRKNLGYLYAIGQGATSIVDSDDDNIPYDHWSVPDFSGDFNTTGDQQGFVNIYKSFTNHHVWPRGFPLNMINDTRSVIADNQLNVIPNEVGIWQGLADSDPDVDAIYRLVDNREVFFDDRSPIVLGRNSICPFNSQNTAFRKEVFPLLYLPCFVNFRFTDILRGLVAQPILWKHNYRLGFTKATVLQKRNLHNYLHDFKSEIPCYLYADRIIKVVESSLIPGDDMESDILNAYIALAGEGIVEGDEVEMLRVWIKDLMNIRTTAPSLKEI